ncbi:MAG: VanZ family protein [Bacteroidales bacterium]|nr:VanZ family protein [Bacteroidales bacterium]
MKRFIISPKLNLSLYTLLLIITPFLLLQNYMQSAIGLIGSSGFNVGTVLIPYTVILVLSVAITAIIIAWKYISLKRIFGIFIFVVMLFVGQHASDFYFNHNFYDLQYNWHFIAYSIFALLAFRYFHSKNLPPAKIILNSFLLALCISSFDEIIQVFISQRVFDISDISKDVWGVLMGIVLIQITVLDAVAFTEFKIRYPKIKDYFKNPFTVLFHLIVFTYIFLWISALLTNKIFWGEVVFFTILIYLIIFFVIHIAKTKLVRWTLRGLIVLLLSFIAFAVLKKEKHVSVLGNSLIVYNGIPIYYFDLLIYNDGRFRLVDKKDFFNQRDKLKINSFDTDIVIFGTGMKGEGGKGFNDQLITEMRYSDERKDIYQIIKLNNKEAAQLFNKLSKEDKKVHFIIYNN